MSLTTLRVLLTNVWQKLLACRTARALGWLLVVAWLLFCILLLVLRYAVFPQIENYREDLTRVASSALHLPVSIGTLSADWQGLRPRLVLQNVVVKNKAGQPALSLNKVNVVVAWSSLLLLEPRLQQLEIVAPSLTVSRDAQGHLYVAGLSLDGSGNSDPDLADWVLKQHQVIIRNGSIVWQDELRKAPPLALAGVQFQLNNFLQRHRFGLQASPPADMASALDIRGELHGKSFSQLDVWHGEVYANVASADLVVWRQWFAYPIALTQGRGGLRLWLGLEKGALDSVLADVALRDVSVRFAATLPILELTSLSGRIALAKGVVGKKNQAALAEDFRFDGSKLQLTMAGQAPLSVPDIHLAYSPQGGELTTTDLNIGVLSRLAGHLPLPTKALAALTSYQPGGKLSRFKLAWQNETTPDKAAASQRVAESSLAHFQVAGRFDGLSLTGSATVPGGAGLSGEINGDENKGRLTLDSKKAAIELPMVFPESRIALDKLSGSISWGKVKTGTNVVFDGISFANADATGSLKGSYRYEPKSAGFADIQAVLTQAKASAVYRYLPHVVGDDARVWLKDSLRSGLAKDVRLVLKGPLDKFPFNDGSGQFTVKGNITDGVLAFAPGWPEISGIQGNLLFEGMRMLITANKATTLGVPLTTVTAEIPDLETVHAVLNIKGGATGKTANFFQYIEKSQVDDLIGHATDGMTGDGNGTLDLKFSMPLDEVDATKVGGSFRFIGNRISLGEQIPPLENVSGLLEFSEKGIQAKDMRSQFLGGPASFTIKTQPDTSVLVNAQGQATATRLGAQYDLPYFNHVSGPFKWTGQVAIRDGKPNVRVISDLLGVSSSLPEPLNKSALEARPVAFELKVVPGSTVGLPGIGEATQLGLNMTGLRLETLMGADAPGKSIQLRRGLVQVGKTVSVPMPTKGYTIAINMPSVDMDAWTRLMPTSSADATVSVPAVLPAYNVQSADLTFLGRHWHDAKLTAQQKVDRLSVALASKELSGDFDYWDQGKGRVVGKVSQFGLSSASVKASSGEALRQLPELDLTVDSLQLDNRDLGSAHITAENKGDAWNTKLEIKNGEGSLLADGRWKWGATDADSQFNFKFSTSNIEKTLTRIGYPKAVKRGKAQLEGTFAWHGLPYVIDYASLNGQIKAKAEDGQFSQLEPGAGRLLGVISLQALPRRVTLDFRDIFSAGFAFDSIAGSGVVKKGVLETADLEIQGPAARVAMQGNVDLNKETQNFRVRVQPAFGETLATGVLLANPVTGLTTWVVNKLFGRPLDKIFAYEYRVSGPWSDPQVGKVGGGVPAPETSK